MISGVGEVQERNLRKALAVASTKEEAQRLAFAIWSESRGYIYANDGRNTSKSPGVTSIRAEILRRSLNLPHDAVGSNGRSTGMLQQISEEVGGGWGDMAGTMDPATSAVRFLEKLKITDNPVYSGTLVTPTGNRKVNVNLTPIAADVLRVQQPLADEAESSNYNEQAVRLAMNIADAFWQPPRLEPDTGTSTDEGKDVLDMTEDELKDAICGATVGTVVVMDVASGWKYLVNVGTQLFKTLGEIVDIPNAVSNVSVDDQIAIGQGANQINATVKNQNMQQIVVLRYLAGNDLSQGIRYPAIDGFV